MAIQEITLFTFAQLGVQVSLLKINGINNSEYIIEKKSLSSGFTVRSNKDGLDSQSYPHPKGYKKALSHFQDEVQKYNVEGLPLKKCIERG